MKTTWEAIALTWSPEYFPPRNSMSSWKLTVKYPNTYKVVGTYKSYAAAHKAMTTDLPRLHDLHSVIEITLIREKSNSLTEPDNDKKST
jgi:hypothetical protein